MKVLEGESIEEFAVRFRAAHLHDELGDVAQKLLRETDTMRVWTMKLEPGESSDLHHHDVDYLLVFVAGDRISGVPSDPAIAPLDATVTPGHFWFIEKGGTEWAVNTGEQTFRELLIELKS